MPQAASLNINAHLQWFVQNFIHFVLIMVLLKIFPRIGTEKLTKLVSLQLNINNTRDDEQINL